MRILLHKTVLTTEESDDDWECEGVEVTNIFNILDDEINNEE